MYKQVRIDTSTTNASPSQIETEHQTIQYDLQSATHLGDTVLHLLASWGHDELALKVFQKDVSLLKARNNKLETPLHCAARSRNEKFILNLIQHNSYVVKDALALTNDNGDTAMHVAAKRGSGNIGHELMNLDPEVAYKVNKEGSFPLQIAIANAYTGMAKTMLKDDPTLAFIHDSNGMFPVHVAARMGNCELVEHIMQKYPDGADLLDPRGRNLFHIAVEENHPEIFWVPFHNKEIAKKMNCATDYGGNTPLHTAAMMENLDIMKYILIMHWHRHAEYMKNDQHLTPLELYQIQLGKSAEVCSLINKIFEL
jgi:ankyrin repeat protein